jgi:hypothetical protein
MDQINHALFTENIGGNNGTNNKIRWIPAVDMMIDNIHPHLRAQPFFVLLDPGSSNALVNQRSIPTDLTITVNGTTYSTTAYG